MLMTQIVQKNSESRPVKLDPHYVNIKKKKKAFAKWEISMLKDTFKDLSVRGPGKGQVDKESFLKFFSGVSGILGERLFHVFDVNKDGFIDFDELICGVHRHTGIHALRSTSDHDLCTFYRFVCVSGRRGRSQSRCRRMRRF